MSNIDLSYLEEITGGDNEMMIEMIDLFLEETPVHIENLKELHAGEEWRKFGAEAHKVKPTFLYVGLNELSEKALKLENIGKEENNLELLPDLIAELEAGFKSAVSELDEIKKRLS